MTSLIDFIDPDVQGVGATETCTHGREITLETDPRSSGHDAIRDLAEQFVRQGHAIERGEHQIVLRAGDGEPLNWFSIDTEALNWWKANIPFKATFTQCSACAPGASAV
ncbi:hypothetical protein ACT17_32640 [Mycolicibacterium conceptionense]|uniref:Uncharacterized protein n=1 Tax=Mycolicibacterium conceptionense TaxID=451644 RepID=A0A0J8TWX3_9MYCO|nr:hypothetical protein [Mycolicibacterium conceptionense]KMV13931.1 hypothetical protein ACT17_32640 [Mycolicibacterium conceptionense]